MQYLYPSVVLHVGPAENTRQMQLLIRDFESQVLMLSVSFWTFYGRAYLVIICNFGKCGLVCANFTYSILCTGRYDTVYRAGIFPLPTHSPPTTHSHTTNKQPQPSSPKTVLSLHHITSNFSFSHSTSSKLINYHQHIFVTRRDITGILSLS